MGYIYSCFLQQITKVTIYCNQKLFVQKILIFETLGTSASRRTRAKYPIERVIRLKLLQHPYPKRFVILIFQINHRLFTGQSERCLIAFSLQLTICIFTNSHTSFQNFFHEYQLISPAICKNIWRMGSQQYLTIRIDFQ